MTQRALMIYLENEQDTIPVTYKLRMLLRRAILETLDYEQVPCARCEISMTFTDNEGIRTLNRTHRQIDRATDVLSFPLYAPETEDIPSDGALGDIVISLERAREQAQTYGHSFERETAFLCVHSMLHLLGYDHELGEAEDADMRRRQREIMARLGLSVQQDTEQITP